VQEGPAPTVLRRPVTGDTIRRPVTIDRTLAIADIIAGRIGVESPRVRVLRRGDSASDVDASARVKNRTPLIFWNQF
jgi:hypothetical protein